METVPHLARGFVGEEKEFGLEMPKAGFMKVFARNGNILPEPDFFCVVYSMIGLLPSEYTKYQVRFNFLTQSIKVLFEMKNGLFKISESHPKSEAILR